MESSELRRQFFHIFLGTIVISLIYYDVKISYWLFIIFVVGLAISLICRKWKVPGLQHLIDSFERPKHQKTLPGKGIIFFFLGAWLVVRFFPKDIALAALAILTFGDAFATLISLGTGRRQHPLNRTKLVEASIGGTVAGFLTAWIFVVWWQALIAAVVAMIVEVLEIEIYESQLDDNLSVPVIAAAVIFLLRLI